LVQKNSLAVTAQTLPTQQPHKINHLSADTSH